MGKAILSPSSKQESASIPQGWSIYWGERLNVYSPKEAHSYSVFFSGAGTKRKAFTRKNSSHAFSPQPFHIHRSLLLTLQMRTRKDRQTYHFT